MARYTGPVCRLCRREGMKLYLKGEKCLTPKCPFERRPYPPGMHAQKRKKPTEYGLQLREKQKARRIYGILERQFRKHFEEAERRPGVTGENLLQILEMRLDNIVYRLGFAVSRSQARQLVRHGHFRVNGRRLDIPSALLRPGDEITVRSQSRDMQHFQERMAEVQAQRIPGWLQLDPATMTGRVVAVPTRQEIDTPVNEQLIVEYYSR
jgi:small subunit ribosomal protein S4